MRKFVDAFKKRVIAILLVIVMVFEPLECYAGVNIGENIGGNSNNDLEYANIDYNETEIYTKRIDSEVECDEKPVYEEKTECDTYDIEVDDSEDNENDENEISYEDEPEYDEEPEYDDCENEDIENENNVEEEINDVIDDIETETVDDETDSDDDVATYSEIDDIEEVVYSLEIDENEESEIATVSEIEEITAENDNIETATESNIEISEIDIATTSEIVSDLNLLGVFNQWNGHSYLKNASETVLTVRSSGDDFATPISTATYGVPGYDKLVEIIFDGNIKIKSGRELFAGCEKLKKITFEGTVELTDEASDLSYMFENCYNLESIDLSSFNTKNIRNMRDMFKNCRALTELDLTTFDTSKVTNFSYMFEGCTNIEKIYVTDKFVLNESSSLSSDGMFRDCSSIDGGFGTTYDSAKTDGSMAYIDGTRDKDGIVRDGYFDGVRYWGDCILDWNKDDPYESIKYQFTINVPEPEDRIYHDKAEASDPDYDYNFFGTLREVIGDKRAAKTLSVSFGDGIVFREKIPFGDYSGDDISKKGLFNMPDTNNIFETFIILSIDTSKVIDMSYMFYNCSVLKNIDLSKFNTSNVEDISYMFANCSMLSKFDLGNNVLSVTDTSGLLKNCSSFKTFDFSNFDITNTTDTSEMFYGCSLFKLLDLSNLNLNNVTNTKEMFRGCTSLETIYVSNDFDSSIIEGSYMFEGCVNLEGYFGSKISNSGGIVDSSRAKIDKGSSDKGYFSKKLYWGDLMCSFEGDDTNGYIMTVATPSEFIKKVWNDKKSESDPDYDYNLWGTLRETIGVDAAKKIKEIDFTAHTIIKNSMKDMFKCERTSLAGDSDGILTTIKFGNIDTSRVTNMESTFKYCSELVDVDFTNFDTSNVTSMFEMFYGCRKMQKFDLSSFDTSSLIDMSYMFHSCEQLADINLTSFNTSSVTNMSYVFVNCKKIENIDLSSFDTSNVTTFVFMFNESGFKKLDLKNFNTSKATLMYSMFSGCKNLESVYIDSFDTRNVTDMTGMFSYCAKIKELDLSSFNTEKLEGMFLMFAGCSNLETIYVSDKFTTSHLTKNLTGNIFSGCEKLKGYFGTKFIDKQVADKTYALLDGPGSDYKIHEGYFSKKVYWGDKICKFDGNLTDGYILTVSSPSSAIRREWNDKTSEDDPDYNYNVWGACRDALSGLRYRKTFSSLPSNIIKYVREINFADDVIVKDSACSMFAADGGVTVLTDIRFLGKFDTSNVTDMSSMFDYCEALGNVDLSILDTSKVTNMARMFFNCKSLQNMDFSNFDTSQVTDMNNMFYSCKPRDLDLTSFDTSKVTNMEQMFYKFNGNKLDITSFDTSNVTNMKAIFQGAGFETIDLSNFSIEKLTSIEGMFSGCSYMKTIDLSGFDTSKITNMANLFYGCHDLTELDIRNFDTRNVTDMSGMFGNCTQLVTIYAGENFDTSKVTNSNNMFLQCLKLYGCFGTSCFVEGKTDKTYARIDGTIISGKREKGYFSTEFYWGDCTFKVWKSAKVADGLYIEVYPPNPDDRKWNDKESETDPDYDYNLWGTFREVFGDEYANKTYQVVFKEGIVLREKINIKDDLYDRWKGLFQFPQGSKNILTEIDFSDMDTSRVKDMSYMFYYCENLKKIDLSKFDTSNVTNFYRMFAECYALTEVNLSSFDTSNATNMSNMFHNCKALQKLDLSNFDLSKCENMKQMFESCEKLSEIKLSSLFNTKEVTDMSYLFHRCISLNNIDLSSFDTSKVTTMAYMFESMPIKKLDLTNFDTSKVFDMNNMFANCSELLDVDLSSFDTSNVTNMDWMFLECRNLKNLDLTSFDTSRVTRIEKIFYDCGSLEKIYASDKFDLSNAPYASAMFTNCSKLKGTYGTAYSFSKTGKEYAVIDGSIDSDGNERIGYFSKIVYWGDCIVNISGNRTKGFDIIVSTPSNAETRVWNDKTSESDPDYDYNFWGTIKETFGDAIAHKIKTINFEDGVVVRAKISQLDFHEFLKDYGLFSLDENNLLTSIVFNNIDTSRVTDMSYMFNNCGKLTKLDLSNFDTSNVTNMMCMFDYCYNLSSLDISNFDTSKVESMYCMFEFTSIKTLDLSHFDTSNVVNMAFMFDACEKLESLNISLFDTSKVKTMKFMFAGVPTKSLDLSNFDTSKVTDMAYMFISCENLEEINLSSFDTSKVEYMDELFKYCYKLKTIYVSDLFVTTNVTEGEDIFYDCKQLKGYYGTKFDSSKKGLEYAKIDGGSNDKGYFSKVHYFGDLSCTFDGDDENGYVMTVASPSKIFKRKWNDKESETDPDYDYNLWGTLREVVGDDKASKIKQINFNEDVVLREKIPVGTYYGDDIDKNGLFSIPLEDNKLVKINFNKKFDTSKVLDMQYMFYNCSGLTTIDLSKFTTNKVTNMECMFNGCYRLSNVNITKFDTTSVTNFSGMFAYCYYLTNLDLSHIVTSNATNTYGMFCYCTRLASLDLSKFDTTKITNMKNMFYGCEAIKELDLTSFDTRQVTDTSGMFAKCNKLKTIYVGKKFQVSNVSSSDNMFIDCTSIVGQQGTVYDETHVDKTYAVPDAGDIRPGYLTMLLYWGDCTYSQVGDETTGYDIIVSKPDPTKTRTYKDSTARGSYDYNLWGTLKEVFEDEAELIKTIKFNDGVVLRAIIPNAKTGDYTDGLFGLNSPNKLSSIDLGSINTSKSTDMSYMFYNCENLSTIDLSKFNTANVKDMNNMFYNCSNITELHMENISTIKVTDMTNMFNNCNSLRTIYVKDAFVKDALSASSNMFNGCNNIVGGNGTTYDASKIDGVMAEKDMGNKGDVKGYLTRVDILVTFNPAGGNVSPTSIEIPFLATISEIPRPTRNSYKFNGWKLNGVSYDFSKKVESDITLVANWTYNGGGGGGRGSGGGGGGGGSTRHVDEPKGYYIYYGMLDINNATVVNENNSKWIINNVYGNFKLDYTTNNWVTDMYADNNLYIYVRNITENSSVSVYFFDNTSNLYLGWIWTTLDDAWYYAEKEDILKVAKIAINEWKLINGKWYYFGPDGKMLKDTVTPDGYKVSATGEWYI